MLSDMLIKHSAESSTPEELYTELFRIGEHYMQQQGEYRPTGSQNFKGNPIVYVNENEKYDGKMRRYIMLEDTFVEQLHNAMKEPSNLLNAVSYYGRKKDKEHADRCFGLIFDIDEVDEVTLNRFLYGCQEKHHVYPMPNYLVISSSGKGVHLYYFFDEPVRLYPNTKVQLKKLKHGMTTWLWNRYTSNDENVQYQSYDQSFMIAGTKENMTVWKLRVNRYSVKSLFDMAKMDYDERLWIENKYTLEEAKQKFPQWYEKVIVEGNTEKGHWKCNRALYDWWLRKMLNPVGGATYGHRYWCMMMLVIYAVKCGVPYAEVKAQAYSLIERMNEIKPDKPFTKSDVKSALECYDIQFATFPIDDISRLSGIAIEKNKRNGRTQEKHLRGARAIRDINNENWREGNGRKPKKDIVQKWQQQHPAGKKIDCSRDTGLHINTVYKWWT